MNKKKIMSLVVAITFMVGFTNVYASSYSNCVSKCKNLPSSDRNTCEKACYTSAIQDCKSKGNSSAIDSCINTVDSDSNSHKYNTLDSSVNECSYSVSCDTLVNKFPNYNVARLYKGSESTIKLHISNDLKLSVLVDGVGAHSNGESDMIASLCGMTYEGGSNQLQGINVTEIYNDDSIGNTMIDSGKCPSLKLGLHDDKGGKRLYAITQNRYDEINVKFDSSFDINGSSSVSNSTVNKMECYYDCRYHSANTNETIKIIKKNDNTFDLDVSQKNAYKSDWSSSIANVIDCPSKVYINGTLGSLYIDTNSSDSSNATCSPVTEDEYYGNSEKDVKVNEHDDYTAVCGILTKDAQDFIYRILDWIKYGALVLTIGLSIFDFFKAVASEEDDAFKKAAKKLMRRVIVVVILFLLPVILEFILKLTHIQGVDRNNPLCTK